MDDIVLKTVVVDYSDTQRTLVGKLVSCNPNLVLESSYDNCLQAHKGIVGKEIDLVFLAIEMPLVNGFDLARSINKSIQIIFICDNPDYALRAFDYNATDFLRKPFERERFNMAVQRAVTNRIRAMGVPTEEEFIYVRSDMQEKKVVLSQINWIEALGDYIKLCTDKGSVLVHSTLRSFSERLPQDRFIRIHRSYTVNIRKVEKFCSTSVEICGYVIPLSRKKKLQLEEALTAA